MSINIIQPVIKSSEIHSPFLIFIRKYFYLGSQKKKKKKGNKLVTFFLEKLDHWPGNILRNRNQGRTHIEPKGGPGPKIFFLSK